jgi:hypothetical protein
MATQKSGGSAGFQRTAASRSASGKAKSSASPAALNRASAAASGVSSARAPEPRLPPQRTLRSQRASFEGAIRRNPLVAAGAALMVGVVLGRFVL